MPGLIDRLPMLVEIWNEDRDIIRANAEDPVKDRNGMCSSSLVSDLRGFAVADFMLKHDIASFRSQLSESAEIYLHMFERFDRGEPIDPSYIAMLAYKELFNALAAGNLSLAKSFASHMGGRDKIEKEHDHPFDYAMGYTLRAFVLGDLPEMQKWQPLFEAVCHKHFVDCLGYATVFQAMLTGNPDLANQGMQSIINGHKKQSKGRGVFADTDDEMLCIWGLGMANLARSRGLSVESVPPLIPNELLI